jgi:hypothetical protein
MWALARGFFECRAVMVMILPLFTQLRGVNGRCLFLGVSIIERLGVLLRDA